MINDEPKYLITKILAEEIKDSRGNPTLKVTVWSGNSFDSFSVPSGASTGAHEAHELRDLDGKGVKNAIEKAKEIGAMGVFESKYGQMVKVYTIGQGSDIVSCEICGGPHVDRTGIMGHFKIVKEESSSSGVRRIKAILE